MIVATTRKAALLFTMAVAKVDSCGVKTKQEEEGMNGDKRTWALRGQACTTSTTPKKMKKSKSATAVSEKGNSW
jgi:hypothetical protein